MGRRGRKPAPTQLKVLEGTRRDRINSEEPPPVSGDPVPPDHLDKVARAEFHRIAEDLRSLQVLSRTDQTALALYSQTYSRWVAAENSIAEFGLLMGTGRGGVAPNPAIAIARDAMQAMQRLLVEFGCTPSARSRLKCDGPAKPADALELFIKGKVR
jgi:P27 family predicted phage terminase small subunit